MKVITAALADSVVGVTGYSPAFSLQQSVRVRGYPLPAVVLGIDVSEADGVIYFVRFESGVALGWFGEASLSAAVVH